MKAVMIAATLWQNPAMGIGRVARIGFERDVPAAVDAAPRDG